MTEISREHELFQLSASQMNIWNIEKLFPGTPINNICETVRLHGAFNIELIQKTLNTIIENDSTLRLRFVLEDNRPMQYIAPYKYVRFPVYDFTTTDEASSKHWEEAVTKEVFKLLDSPLYSFIILKVGEHEGKIIFKLHHLISDGWSQVELTTRLSSIYASFLRNDGILPEPPLSYLSHIEDENNYFKSKSYAKSLDFWREHLKDFPNPVTIKDQVSAETSMIGRRKTIMLSDVLNNALTQFCLNNNISPSAVLLMALSIYLKRTRGASRFCVGVPIHNRSSFDDKRTTGMFVSTLPFFISVDESKSFAEFTESYAVSWFNLLRHQKVPYTEILKIAKSQNPDADRLFNIVVSFHSSRIYFDNDISMYFSGEWHYSGYQLEHLCIHMTSHFDDRRYSVNYDYLTQLFSDKEIELLHDFLMNILYQAMDNPDRPISRIALISTEEEERVVYAFNRTERLVKHSVVFNKLDEVYKASPKKVAVISDGKRYSYDLLRKYANGIANAINKAVDKPCLTAIMLPKSFELYAAIAAVIHQGGSWLVLSADMPMLRIADILQDSGAKVLVTDTASLEKSGISTDLPIVFTHEIAETDESHLTGAQNGDQPAYVIYTSGSTGKPKGVEISQKSLINFSEAMRDIYSADAVLSLCSTTFDAFIIESAAALLNGRTIVLPADIDHESPARIAELITSYAVGFISLTPSRLTAFLKNNDFKRAVWRLDTIICGGEAFPAELIKTIAAYTKAAIYNQYGPSETTVGVTIKKLNNTQTVTIGKPMQNCKCYVLDKELHPLPAGAAGDLYIGGICVGMGYLNNKQLTDEAFVQSPFEQNARIYKTGDIAAWNSDGELIIKGREDGQVKIRGQRIELDEISSRLSAFPGIKEAVARVVNINGGEFIAVYYSADHSIPDIELFDFAAAYLPVYMIPSVFKRLENIPLTENGKVDFRKLPVDFNLASTDSGFNNSAVEMVLEIFKRVLSKPSMKITDEYFMSGGDSLNALETINELEKSFGTRIRVTDLYMYKTAQMLGKHFNADSSPQSVGVAKAPQSEYYPLTASQLGIYFETAMNSSKTLYNMPCGFIVNGELDIDKLRMATAALLNAEPVFRTAFIAANGTIVQKIIDNVEPYINVYYNSDLSEAIAHFVAPFDLSKPPLLRVGVVILRDGRTALMMDIHHIVGDGATAAMALKTLDLLYRGGSYNPSALKYHDYAYYESQNIQTLIDREKPYWDQALANLPPLPDLPYIAKQTKFDYIGGECQHMLTKAQTNIIERYCEAGGVTPFMLFTAAYCLFISKISGATDLTTGIPVSTRRSRELVDMAGLLIKAMPLRIKIDYESSVLDYINTVKNAVIGLLDNPHTPLDRLVKSSGSKQNSLYNTMLSMRPLETDGFTFASLDIEPLSVPANSAKVDLNVEIFKSQGAFGFRIEYAATLFQRSAVELFARTIAAAAVALAQNPSQCLDDCDIMAPLDKQSLIMRPNAMSQPFYNVPVDMQIDSIALQNASKTALICGETSLTFGELLERAEVLAGRLQSQGAQCGDNIGVFCKRGVDMIISLYAVLKAGCAYVPILPSFPHNRVQYMLQTSQTHIVICDDAAQADKLDGVRLITPDSVGENHFTVQKRGSDDLCFVLFTSGSTGQPKGVKIRHRSISNLISTLAHLFDDIDGSVLCATNSIFDIFFTESLMALANAKTVVLASEDEMVLPWKAAQLITKNNVKLMQLTPSRALQFLENKDFRESLGGMQKFLLAGEALPMSVVSTIKECGCDRVYNLYGPTEGTVYATFTEVTNADYITIGKMVNNSRGYVLDNKGRYALPMSVGELYIAGECLSSGYAGRDDLTAEMFEDDLLIKNEKMYRTGDMVRLMPDGSFDYVGRLDFQIKLNGQRIELNEINQKILASGYAAQSAVVLATDGDFKRLRAYIVPKNYANEEAIREYLKNELPAYMIPSEIKFRSEFPQTASGKTDLLQLSQTADEPIEPQPETRNDEVIIEVADKKDMLMYLWKNALGGEVDPDKSFFEQGGTSMTALGLISQYYNNDITILLSEFYENPTINDQLKLLGSEPISKSQSGKTALLTGATGFLGAHLLKDLANDGYTKIYCLVRDDDNAIEKLRWYHGDNTASLMAIAELIKGDVTLPNMGISDEIIARIGRLDTIIHAAADVRHYSPDASLENTNYQGTVNAVDVCLKTGAKLVYISTLSLCGEFITAEPSKKALFTENDFDIGQNWQTNAYLRSKFNAEQYILKAMENKGLSAIICRVGRLVGRGTDGLFQYNPEFNLFRNIIVGMSELKQIDAVFYNLPVEITAVDECSQAIIKLIDSKGPVYHLCNPNSVTVGEIAESLNLGIKPVEERAFKEYLSEILLGVDGFKNVSLIDTYSRFKKAAVNITPTCQITLNELKTKGFEWKPQDPSVTLKTFVHHEQLQS